MCMYVQDEEILLCIYSTTTYNESTTGADASVEASYNVASYAGL